VSGPPFWVYLYFSMAIGRPAVYIRAIGPRKRSRTRSFRQIRGPARKAAAGQASCAHRQVLDPGGRRYEPRTIMFARTNRRGPADQHARVYERPRPAILLSRLGPARAGSLAMGAAKRRCSTSCFASGISAPGCGSAARRRLPGPGLKVLLNPGPANVDKYLPSATADESSEPGQFKGTTR